MQEQVLAQKSVGDPDTSLAGHLHGNIAPLPPQPVGTFWPPHLLTVWDSRLDLPGTTCPKFTQHPPPGRVNSPHKVGETVYAPKHSVSPHARLTIPIHGKHPSGVQRYLPNLQARADGHAMPVVTTLLWIASLGPFASDFPLATPPHSTCSLKRSLGTSTRVAGPPPSSLGQASPRCA